MNKLILIALLCALWQHSLNAQDCVLQNIKDKNNQADYLIISPDEFTKTLIPFVKFEKQQGLETVIVKTSSIYREFKNKKSSQQAIKEFIHYAIENWKKPSPEFALLIGDIDRIPPFILKSKFTGFKSEKNIASDYPFCYKKDHGKPLLSIGRFPADTQEELKNMIQKTIKYQSQKKSGQWRRKIIFVTSEGGFGELIDKIMEKMFEKIVMEEIPSEYEIKLLYGKTSSPYCYYPPDFNKKVTSLINEGCLFFAYVGHGTTNGFYTIKFKNKSYDIFSAKHIKLIDVKTGPPVMFAFACSTARLDNKHDCFGEQIFKLKNGPVCYIGATRVVQPYVNAVFGEALISAIFKKGATTVGKAITWAKKEALSNRKTKFRKFADTIAGMIQGKENLDGMLQDGVHHYILFGDPALKICFPRGRAKLDFSISGRTLIVKGDILKNISGKATVTFECQRSKFIKSLKKIKEDDPDFKKKINARWQIANNKVITKAEVKIVNGKFRAMLQLPEKLKKGRYIIKCLIICKNFEAVGAKNIKIGD